MARTPSGSRFGKSRRASSRLERICTVAYISLGETDSLIPMIREVVRLGLRPAVFMDARTTPDELRQLDLARIRYTVVRNEFRFVEGLYGLVASHVLSPWVWILTSDEVPSAQAVESAAQQVGAASPSTQCLGFARQWIYRSARGEAWRSRAPFIGDDYQWRIIRRDAVTFSPMVHTPGFIFDRDRAVPMPTSAPVYHFDWIVHSLEMRRKKLGFYDGLQEGMADLYRGWYVPEDNMGSHHFEAVEDTNCQRVVGSLGASGASHGWVDRV